MFKSILSDMNVAGGGKKFQFGGITPSIPGIGLIEQRQQFEDLSQVLREQQIVAIIEDITNTQTQIAIRENRADLG